MDDRIMRIVGWLFAHVNQSMPRPSFWVI